MKEVDKTREISFRFVQRCQDQWWRVWVVGAMSSCMHLPFGMSANFVARNNAVSFFFGQLPSSFAGMTAVYSWTQLIEQSSAQEPPRQLESHPDRRRTCVKIALQHDISCFMHYTAARNQLISLLPPFFAVV